jgi:hypothetical protein
LIDWQRSRSDVTNSNILPPRILVHTYSAQIASAHVSTFPMTVAHDWMLSTLITLMTLSTYPRGRNTKLTGEHGSRGSPTANVQGISLVEENWAMTKAHKNRKVPAIIINWPRPLQHAKKNSSRIYFSEKWWRPESELALLEIRLFCCLYRLVYTSRDCC